MCYDSRKSIKTHQPQYLLLSFLQVHIAKNNLILRLRGLGIGFHTFYCFSVTRATAMTIAATGKEIKVQL